MSIEAMKQALEALEKERPYLGPMPSLTSKAITAIKAALPQPAQEPVAWITPDGEGFRIRFSAPTNDVPLGWDALYTTPPKRTWVGLTNEDYNDIFKKARTGEHAVQLAEARLKEKNNG